VYGFFIMEKTMNINEMQNNLSDKLLALDGMDNTSEEYTVALEAAEKLKAEIDKAQANEKRMADLKASANAFEPSKVKQSINPSKGFIVKEGFTEDPKCGFESAGEFLQTVVKQGKRPEQDARLAHLVQTAGTHTTENDGLMIPSEFAQGLLLNESDIQDDWLSNIMVEQTSSNSKTFKRSSSNTLGGSVGITCSRIAENTQMSSTKEVFETTVLPLDKLYIYTEVTEEDLEDIPWLSSHLTMQAPKIKRKKIAGEFLNGTGVQEAQGMFNTNNSNKIAVTRDTASTVKAEDIAAMSARLISREGAFWIINRDVRAKLPLMSVGNMPVYTQDFRGATYVGQLDGLPVYESEHCSALGTQGDVRLINPAGYRALEKVGGSKFSTSAHVKFDYDLMAFKWTHRISGISWSNDVYTPTNGSTLSAFVELN
jgi:HK97 family phage major capsid protein